MKPKVISIIIGIMIIILALIFLINSKYLFLVLGLAVIIAAAPFVLSFLVKENKEKEKEEMFLLFCRNLVESVKSGTPLSRSILIVSDKEYGSLTEHTKKLASQVNLGIPVRQAFMTFSNDVNNNTISRAISLVIQAESSGGDISSILDAVVANVSQIEEIKKERSSQVYSLVVQGYIIFFIFLIIMLFVQVKFMPLIFKSFATDTNVVKTDSMNIMDRSFFILILVQALFTGLVVGKLGEGKLKAGIKHSVVLLVISFLFLALSRILA
jgi:flagellar protein FlaJ